MMLLKFIAIFKLPLKEDRLANRLLKGEVKIFKLSMSIITSWGFSSSLASRELEKSYMLS